jgi:sulfite oxidase
LTPADSFYGRNHGPIPVLDSQAWRLRVDGLVDRPLELSLGDLRSRFPDQSLTATPQCAGKRRSGLIAVRDIPGEAPKTASVRPGSTPASSVPW